METQMTETLQDVWCDVTTTKVMPTLLLIMLVFFNHFIGGKASHDTSDTEELQSLVS